MGLPVLISERVNIWREVVEDGAGLADADTLGGTAAMLMRWHALAPAERLAMKCARQRVLSSGASAWRPRPRGSSPPSRRTCAPT